VIAHGGLHDHRRHVQPADSTTASQGWNKLIPGWISIFRGCPPRPEADFLMPSSSCARRWHEALARAGQPAAAATVTHIEVTSWQAGCTDRDGAYLKGRTPEGAASAAADGLPMAAADSVPSYRA